MVVNPSVSDYINTVHSRIIRNCPVATEAVTTTNTIFGPDVASLKGKTTRKTSDPVIVYYAEIPQKTLDLNKTATLLADVTFVNGLRFFVSTSQNTKFTLLKYIPK